MTREAPKVSIIVPVYNTAPYLRQCLSSLVDQSLCDIEIILVDDGSTDESLQILAECAKAHDNVVLVPATHGGPAATRNRGIAAACGEYLAFVDSDDYVSPEMFERLTQRADSTDADIVICSMMGFDDATGEEYPYPEGSSGGFGVALAENPSLMVEVSPSPCNKIFRRTLLAGLDPVFPTDLLFEDLATTYLLFSRANRLEKVERFLYFYRRTRSGSTMSSHDRRFEQLPSALEVMYGRFAADGRFESLREVILEVAIAHLIAGRYADFFPYAPRATTSSYIDSAFSHLDRYFPGWTRDQATRRACPGWWLRTITTHRMLLKAFAALPPRLALALTRRLRMFWTGGV